MYVLGLNVSFHDTSACLIKDGKIIAAIEEERLSRNKHELSYPMRAIRYCLNAANITIKDVDLIVEDIFEDISYEQQEWLGMDKKKLGDKSVKLRHHLGHAASAYYCSSFEDAAIITTDGGGTRGVYKELFKSDKVRERQVFWRGTGKDIIEVSTSGSAEDEKRPTPASVGHVYEMACELLGYGHLEGPGKLMGLASYGTGKVSRDFDQNYIKYPNGHCVHKNNYIGYDNYRRDPSEPISQEHAEIAYMVQNELEEAMIQMANHLYHITRSKNLCISGGVGLNCVANKKVLDNTPFENIYLFPACADSGLAIGNAFYGYYSILGGKRNVTSEVFSPYCGVVYSKEKVAECLEQHKDSIKYQYYDNEDSYLEEVAKLISDGKIVAWYNGGSEIGPRALGNRSILADARNPEMKDILNNRVKHREYFRPFAPAVPLQFASRYFDINIPSPYMLLVTDVLPEARSCLPSITHIDGTARLQTVTEEFNSRFYRLLMKFGALTGTYVILNTSFNVAGEPIVEKPLEAVLCFLGTDIDYLAIENFIISKNI
jgi:carbamoyltransferase